MKKWIASLLALTLLLPMAGDACGGPEFVDFRAPLASDASLLGRIMSPSDDLEDSGPAEPFTFLYPFSLAYPEATQRLLAGGPNPSFEGFETAIRLGDLETAAREARGIEEQVLDAPAELATGHAEDFRRALEFTDLRPLLPGMARPDLVALFTRDSPNADMKDLEKRLPKPLREALGVRGLAREKAAEVLSREPENPRRASLAFVALQEAMRHGIPDGWKASGSRLSPEQAKSLMALHDGWLKRFPQHPLAVLVTLSKVRVAYFADDRKTAWGILLGMYPAHLPRMISEINYLRKVMPWMPGDLPAPWPGVPSDPALAVALRTFEASEAAAAEGWKRSLHMRPRALGLNLQERLLAELASQGERPLPAWFPPEPAQPTPFWAKLRLAILLQHRRWKEAELQAALLKLTGDETAAALVARLKLLENRPLEAVLLPVNAPFQSYLVRIILDDASLVEVSKRGAPPRAAEALLARAVKRVHEGDWAGGAALLATSDPTRSRLWRQAGKLASSPQDAVRYARFLAAHDGKLFFGDARAASRSFKQRWRELASATSPSPPWPREQERAQLQAYLLGTSENFRALEAFTQALGQDVHPGASQQSLLREANQVYNKLLNWDAFGDPEWEAMLAATPAARELRRLGKRG